jgi:hypothetical protein
VIRRELLKYLLGTVGFGWIRNVSTVCDCLCLAQPRKPIRIVFHTLKKSVTPRMYIEGKLIGLKNTLKV